MKVLVIGGAGYIGSQAVLSLLKEEHEVVVFDALENGHKEAINSIEKYTKKKVELFEGNIRNREDVNKFISQNKDADIVMHFAAYIEVGESVQNPLKYYENNVGGTINLLNAMINNGIKKIVFSSTAATYGMPGVDLITEDTYQNPINPYGSSKLMVENILDDLFKSHGLSSIRLRYFNVAGASNEGIIGEDHPNESHLIPRVLLGALGKMNKISIYGDDYPTPDGTCIRDYIYVEDLVNAHILAMDYLMKNEIADAINLGSKNGFSVKEIIDACRRVTGINFEVEVGPRRAGDPPKLIADSTKAKKILGWEPKSTIDNMIQTAWNWHKSHPEGY